MTRKKIPTALQQAVVRQLVNARGEGPLTSGELSSRLNGDPKLPATQKKRPRQLAFILKQMVIENEEIESVVLSKNGISQHGAERKRIGYMAAEGVTLSDAEQVGRDVTAKPRLKQLTVNLPPDCVDYLAVWKLNSGLSAGRVFEQLIKADIEVNGLPDENSD
jgi:hypothetical protein